MTERMPHDLKRSRVLRFRVDDEEWGEIDLARATLGLSMSGYLRRAAATMADAVNDATDDAAHDAWLMKRAEAMFPWPSAIPNTPEMEN